VEGGLTYLNGVKPIGQTVLTPKAGFESPRPEASERRVLAEWKK
jgi:hypothetical protein